MFSRTGRILLLAQAVAAPVVCLLTAPVAAAHDPECDTIMAAGDQLEAVFDQVEPQGYTPPGVGSQIRQAAQPLYQVSGVTAVDLRNWSDILAAKLDHDRRYLQEGSDELWLTADLNAARSHLLAARRYCTWSVYTTG